MTQKDCFLEVLIGFAASEGPFLVHYSPFITYKTEILSWKGYRSVRKRADDLAAMRHAVHGLRC